MEIYIPLLVVLLLLSALFSSAETAFLSLQRVQLEHYVREGVGGASRVSRLLESPRRLLSSILLGNNLVNTGAAAVGTAIAAELVSSGSAVLAATIIVTVLLVVFGEVGPKTVALHHPFALSRLYALPLRHWTRSTQPIVAALDLLSRGVLLLGGGRGEAAGALALGELRTAIALGRESGALEADESEMLLGALTLQQRQVRHIMTPRVAMQVAEVGEPLREVSRRLIEAGVLRLPVYADRIDNIVGYVHVSDVNSAYAADRAGDTARSAMREMIFESERASTARLLERMQESGHHIAILIDEVGSPSGLVTLEDILEEVVGEIGSESGSERSGTDVRVGERLYVEGRRSLADLGAELGADLSHPGAESVGGLVLAYLRRFPLRGESMEHGGHRFIVMAADERKVTLVAVEALPEQSEDAPAE